MKPNRNESDHQQQCAEEALFKAMAVLQSTKEVRIFFKDLCTPAELQALVDRWQVVEYLQKQLPYRKIHDLTGVSVTHDRTGRALPRGRCRRLPYGDRHNFSLKEPQWNTPSNALKLRVQKSGRLTDHSIDLLERCGLKVTRSKDKLICYGENMPIDLLLVRDDDIPGLVSDDVCDLGIVGLNVVEEKRLKLEQEGSKGMFKHIFELEFGQCRLSIAAPENVQYDGPDSLENKRIATSYVVY